MSFIFVISLQIGGPFDRKLWLEHFLHRFALPWFLLTNIEVSVNRGTPKSSILIGCSFVNDPFWGTPISGKGFPATFPLESSERSRPDITHQCLMALLDSPLNKAGCWWLSANVAGWKILCKWMFQWGNWITHKWGISWDFKLLSLTTGGYSQKKGGYHWYHVSMTGQQIVAKSGSHTGSTWGDQAIKLHWTTSKWPCFIRRARPLITGWDSD